MDGLDMYGYVLNGAYKWYIPKTCFVRPGFSVLISRINMGTLFLYGSQKIKTYI